MFLPPSHRPILNPNNINNHPRPDPQGMLSEKARVRRGGKEMDVPAEDLVLGDIVLVESGSRVPADLRIIQSDSLKVGW